MNSYRSNAKTFGIFFILAFLSYGIGNGLINSIINAPDFLSRIYADKSSIVIGVILIALVHSLVNIGLPIVMFPILKPHNAYLTHSYLAAAIIATTLLAFGTIFLLMLLPLSNEHARAEISLIPSIEIMGNLLKKGAYYSYHLGMALWSIGGLMLVALLYQSKLIPRPLSVLGIIGYFFLVSGSVIACFKQGTAVEVISVIPGALFEITLSIWLIFKGFNTSEMKY